MVETVIVYVPDDARSAQLLTEKLKATPLLASQVTEDSLRPVNVIVVGGPITNPWAQFFFPEVWEAFDYEDMLFPAGYPGVSPDRQYIVTTKPKNGTRATLVAGAGEPDTFRAAQAFVSPKFQWGMLLLAAVMFGIVAYGKS